MTLFLNNEDVKSLLTMEITLKALEKSYMQMVKGESVCRPRIDLQIPTSDPQKTYRWGTMEGGSSNGYFAIRMKSDIVFENKYQGTHTMEKYCVQPGTFCGLIFLFRVENGEPLAILNDGYLQHMRVGADSALGVKYMAKEKAEVVGMFGSGGMARTHLESLLLVRDIKKVKVFSPTKSNRELYAREMQEKYNLEIEVLDSSEGVYKDVDILAGCTDANIPIIHGKLVEKGTHITSVGGRPDLETFQRIDRYLRLGNATSQQGQTAIYDEFISYITPQMEEQAIKREHKHASGVINMIDKDKIVYFKEMLEGKKGRMTSEDITYSERGNLQGAQFHAVAGRVYELARERGIGREMPTEWFLQDIRD